MPPPTTNVTLFDENGEAVAVLQVDQPISSELPSGTVLGGVMVAGRQPAPTGGQATARALDMDAGGRAGVRLRNRDGTALEGAFPEVKVGEESVHTYADGHQFIPSTIHRYFHGQTALVSSVNDRMRIDAGTAVGRALLRLGREMPNIAGIGMVARLHTIFSDVGSSGCVREWGLMDEDGGNGFFFRLNGTTLSVVHRANNVDVSVTDAASWNVDGTVIPDANGHLWSIQFRSCGVARVIFLRDEKEVHVLSYNGSDVSLRSPHLTPMVLVQNTSGQGAARYVDIGSLTTSYEQADFKTSRTPRFRIKTEGIVNVTGAGSFTSVLALAHRKTKAGKTSHRRLRVRGVSFSANNTGQLRLRTNVQLTGTNVPDNRPRNPTTAAGQEYEGQTNPVTATLSGTNAGGAGYADGNTVSYQITVMGAVGETLPSAGTASLGVGTPRKQVNLVWNPVTYAVGYRVYRQLNGAGSYLLIAETPSLSFTDDAYAAQTGTPPGSNTAEGDSFGEKWDPITASPGGRSHGILHVAADLGAVASFGDGEMVLQPGENFVVDFAPDIGTVKVSAQIDWEEDLT